MTDLFKRAAAYRKTHKGVSMPEAIKLLAGKGKAKAKKAPVKKAKKAPVKKAKKAPVKKAPVKKAPVKKIIGVKKQAVKKTKKPVASALSDSLSFNHLKALIEKRNSIKIRIAYYQDGLKAASKPAKIMHRKNIADLKKIVVSLNKQISFTKRYIK